MKLFLLSFVFLDVNVVNFNLPDLLIFCPCCLLRPPRPPGRLQALPRRRVSVAVVPKFNLLNIPGQTPATASPGPNQASSPSAGPTTGTALPVLVGLPVLSGNDLSGV